MLFLTTRSRTIGLAVGLALVALLMAASVIYGYTDIGWKTAYEAFTRFDGSNEHIIVRDVRVPRAIIAAVVGASLATAGAIMQTLTKNPLASPGIMGINAGAGFFVVAGITLFYANSLQGLAWLAFAGAGVAAVIVYGIGSIGRDGMTPLKLTLAGAAIAALFASLTQGMLVMNEAVLQQVLFWLAGSVQGRKLELLASVWPYLAIAFLISALIAPKLNIFMMGEGVARGLGLRLGVMKIMAAAAVVLLAGSAVSIAGPVGFLGIIVPHLARYVVGNDHRWLLPYTALAGSVLLIAADIGARYIIMPEEVPVGVMTAFIGTPIFFYIARRGYVGK